MSPDPEIPGSSRTDVRLRVVRPSKNLPSSANTPAVSKQEVDKAEYEAKLLKIYSKVFQEQEENQALLEQANRASRQHPHDYVSLFVIFLQKIINDSERSSDDLYKLIFTGSAIALALFGILLLLKHFLLH